MKRFLAFDIETAKVVVGDGRDLLAHRPLGIACAVATAGNGSKPHVWHGRAPDGSPAGQMTREEAAQLVDDLSAAVAQGHTLVSWNGLGFDFDVLAEESGKPADCARLARAHVDMCFHLLCALGYPISLQKAAEGMGLPGKTAGVSGADAPAMWAARRHREVLDYCHQDVRLTLQVAEACQSSRRFAWLTQRGTLRRHALPDGWLTVDEALALPLPDTSWMSTPLSRASFSAWLSA